MSMPPTLSAAGRRHALLGARARSLARPRRQAEPIASIACIVCEVGGALYGVPLASALRVAPAQNIAPAPSSNPSLVGIFGHAGAFYFVFDLGLLTGGSPAPNGSLILLRSGQSAMALRVEQVLRVADLALLSPDAASGMQAAHAAVSGFARPVQDLFGGRIIALVDPQKLSSEDSGGRTQGDVQ